MVLVGVQRILAILGISGTESTSCWPPTSMMARCRLQGGAVGDAVRNPRLVPSDQWTKRRVTKTETLRECG
jgi:hypothetical protein